MKAIHDCVVIGAGPGGLVCTKELIEQGIEDVLCLEKSAAIGGVFADTYDSLTLTSSCTFSMFSDFWIGDGRQHHFWTKQEVLDYWQAYAHHFGVLPKIRFGVEVVAADPVAEGWRLSLVDGQQIRCRRLALAVGGNRFPNIPDWAAGLTGVSVLHSKDYRNGEPFVGKNVLVVGGGESGADIALEISRVARHCTVSLRTSAGWILPRKRGMMAADIATHRGLYGLPREYGIEVSRQITRHEASCGDSVHDAAAKLNARVSAPYGVWGTYGTKNFSLPEAVAHHGCVVVGGISAIENDGCSIRFADGESLQDIDAIVLCTGYQSRLPFLPEPLRAQDPRALYKHMFHPRFADTLAWIGFARPGFGSQFPIMELQARYFALIASGQQRLPEPEVMATVAEVDARNYLRQLSHSGRRIRNLVDYHRYMDDLAGLIGCMPPFWSTLLLRPRLWLRIVYGATQATQFRLRGPGNKPAVAREILMKLPVSRFNHVVKTGLKGRLWYALRWPWRPRISEPSEA